MPLEKSGFGSPRNPKREPALAVQGVLVVRRLRKTWQRCKRLVLSGAQVGVILAVGFFVFQLLQSWGDGVVQETNLVGSVTLQWVVPGLSALAASLAIGFLFLIWNASRLPRSGTPPSEAFAAAVLEYGRQLSIEGRDRALINLRNNLTTTLHILGFHAARIELGELALQSAALISDHATKAEILIDDLGWAHHLLAKDTIAIGNIDRGVSEAATARSEGSLEAKRLVLCEAKGLRHLAVIEAKRSLEEAQARLETARELLTKLDRPEDPDVLRDLAQIHHAGALSVALSMGLEVAGKLRSKDDTGQKMLEDALQELRAASAIFKQLGDLDRYVKALFLEVRLLEARGSDEEAREVAGVRDRTLAASEWIRPEGTRTLTRG